MYTQFSIPVSATAPQVNICKFVVKKKLFTLSLGIIDPFTRKKIVNTNGAGFFFKKSKVKSVGMAAV